MNEDKHLYNKILDRQLKKFGLMAEALPQDLDKWQQFLERIKNYYEDLEQERYILERSTEIASKESSELYRKLEEAQHIACIGHWNYNPTSQKMTFSKEFFTVLNLDASLLGNTLNQFFENFHEHDRQLVQDTIHKATTSSQNTECEARIKQSENKWTWLQVICHANINIENGQLEIDGVAIDITKRKEAEEKIHTLSQQLLTSARSAGMAEVATSILHNVGNVLNSINVSLNILKESHDLPHFNKLLVAIGYIDEHINNIHEYLAQDEKGKLIPKYLVAVGKLLKIEHEKCEKEVDNLISHINHVKEIVAMQQGLAKVSGFIEQIFLPNVINSALDMSTKKLQSNNIQINKEYEQPIFITTDKAKLLQILINLIQNAQDAILEASPAPNKEITITTSVNPSNQVHIQVKDNGVGISPENLTKIFSFGFTSKKGGHGYGLHSSALYAKEMGGNLQVQSDGIGQGATFSLCLPLQLKEKHNGEQ